MKSKSSVFISSIVIITLATMLNNRLLDSGIVRYAVYSLEILLICYIFYHTKGNIRHQMFNGPFIIASLVLVFNFVFSPYDPVYASLVKYFGYYCCFWFGKSIFETEGRINISRTQCISLVLLPLLIVAIWDNSAMLNMFFTNSNTFTFYGECATLLFLVSFREKKNCVIYSVVILLLYLLVGTSLGVVLALLISILLINRHNKKLVISTAIAFGLAIILVIKIDIPLFVRIRNVVTVFGELNIQDLLKIDDVNLYEINQSVDSGDGRTDNNSAIWRLQHWLHLIKAYLSNISYSFLFGLGEGYSMDNLGNTPHNDVLRVFCEYGIIVFTIWINSLRRAYTVIKRDVTAYLVLGLFLYHFSENLLETFPPNAILYFCLGFVVSKVKHEKEVLHLNY